MNGGCLDRDVLQYGERQFFFRYHNSKDNAIREDVSIFSELSQHNAKCLEAQQIEVF